MNTDDAVKLGELTVGDSFFDAVNDVGVVAIGKGLPEAPDGSVWVACIGRDDVRGVVDTWPAETLVWPIRDDGELVENL